MKDSNDLTPSRPGSPEPPTVSVDAPGPAESASIADVEETLGRLRKLAIVGQLTSGVAHEFNNVLQGIVGSLELVRKLIGLGRAADTEKFTTAALASARRAAALTGRLVDFARPTEALRPELVEANALVASMLDLLRGTQSSSIRIAVAPAADLWTCVCDPNRLEEALVSIVVYAREAMPGGGQIGIETGNVDIHEPRAGIPDVIAPGRYVCIAISDTGPGLSEEQRRHAFDPFFESGDRGGAIRFGLAVVRRFAHEARGYIHLESETARGSTVRLYLPSPAPGAQT